LILERNHLPGAPSKLRLGGIYIICLCFLLLSPGHLDLHRNVVLNRHRQQRWRVNLEIGELGRNGSRDLLFIPLRRDLERHVFVVRGLSGELHAEVEVDFSRARHRLWNVRSHGHHGILRTARHLDHVQVTIAVAGVERLHWYCDQEVALTVMANAFPPRCLTDAVYLMQRMRDVIGEGALVE
jgi:hypothetical protein